jgi:hypothetical protein
MPVPGRSDLRVTFSIFGTYSVLPLKKTHTFKIFIDFDRVWYTIYTVLHFAGQAYVTIRFS